MSGPFGRIGGRGTVGVALSALLVAGCAAGGEGGGLLSGDGSVAPDGSTVNDDATPPGPTDDGGTPNGDDGGVLPGDDGGSQNGDAGGPALLGPPYPIVLAHGFFGFDELAGAIDYWYGIPEALEMAGETVYVTEVDPFNSSAVRGAQLVEQIEAILEETGHAKVNIVGHSQGGMDARVAAYEAPELVASVTTIATPHGGTAVADLVLGITGDGDVANLLLDALTDLLGILYSADTTESDVIAALDGFSSTGIEQFNLDYPDSPGVQYFSLTGTSDRTYADSGPCEVASPPGFVSRWYGTRDTIDILLSVTEDYLDDGSINGLLWSNDNPNDGLVTVQSGKWGRFLGCIPADHLDEVGQLFGGDANCWGFDCEEWDHEQFYVDLAAFLRAEGY